MCGSDAASQARKWGRQPESSSVGIFNSCWRSARAVPPEKMRLHFCGLQKSEGVFRPRTDRQGTRRQPSLLISSPETRRESGSFAGFAEKGTELQDERREKKKKNGGSRVVFLDKRRRSSYFRRRCDQPCSSPDSPCRSIVEDAGESSRRCIAEESERLQQVSSEVRDDLGSSQVT